MMTPLIQINFIICGICLAVGLIHLLVAYRRRNRKADLFFGLMALCMAGSAFSETFMYAAPTVAMYVDASRIHIVFHCFLWVFFAWFIAFVTGSARRWLTIVVTVGYGASLLIHLFSPSGILFDKIEAIHQIVLPWGEQLNYAVGPPNTFRVLPDIIWLVLMYLTVESCIRMGRKGERRRATLLAVCLMSTIGVAYFHGTLVDFDILGPPNIFNFTFLVLIFLMSGFLSSDIVRASILGREVTANEQRWRTLLENVNLAVLGVDTSRRINYVNPYFCKMTGYVREDVIGFQITEFIPEQEQAEVNAHLSDIMEGRIMPQTHRHIRCKDGSARKILWFHVLLKGAGDEPSGSLSVGEDITELEQARQAFEDEKSRMDVVLSSLNTGLALINPDMTIAWVNDLTRSILSWGEPVGQICYEFAESRTEPCEGCGALKVFEDGDIHERERQSPVDKRWHYIVSIPITDESGRVIQVLESVTDITKRKQAEIARDNATAELEQLKTQLEEENIYLREELASNKGFEAIIGNSNAILYILERVRQVAETDATVLIQGETGVGKELIAGAVRENSVRSTKPFIKVNCAALPPNIVESELFGHEPGAFTGADRLRKGRFELAGGGTLLLDEISELPLEVQAKLLRVIQEGQFERVGGSETLSVDVRIIATTNRHLQKEINAGRFRADLYYRLQVYPITVPALRQRKEDIKALVQHFLKEINARIGKKVETLSPNVMSRLLAYDYPGNVRELKNLLEQAVIGSRNGVLQLPKSFGIADNSQGDNSQNTKALISLDAVQRRHIVQVLEHVEGRVEGDGGAAAILGLKPSTLRHRIQKLGIKRSKQPPA